ncbi:S41 family peptidase [Nitrospira sp. Nam74]
MHSMIKAIPVFTLLALLLSVGVSTSEEAIGQNPNAHQKEADVLNGVIGVSLQVGAERVGDPAVLYVGMVHPEGPAHEAGLAHGDEITAVDGVPVSGKTYEQLVKTIRGTAGTVVKLGVKGEAGTREVSIPRVPSESLSKGPVGSYGVPSR